MREKKKRKKKKKTILSSPNRHCMNTIETKNRTAGERPTSLIFASARSRIKSGRGAKLPAEGRAVNRLYHQTSKPGGMKYLPWDRLVYPGTAHPWRSGKTTGGFSPLLSFTCTVLSLPPPPTPPPPFPSPSRPGQTEIPIYIYMERRSSLTFFFERSREGGSSCKRFSKERHRSRRKMLARRKLLNKAKVYIPKNVHLNWDRKQHSCCSRLTLNIN